MDFLGIAPLELLVVLLVAVLVLGPIRMVEAARGIGKFWRQAQSVLRGLADDATVDLKETEEAALPKERVLSPEDSIARSSQEVIQEKSE